MIQLKEINPKLYMKGTKALRFQVYLWLAALGYTAAVTIPVVYFSRDKVRLAREKNLRRREETERLKNQQLVKICEAMQQQAQNEARQVGN